MQNLIQHINIIIIGLIKIFIFISILIILNKYQQYGLANVIHNRIIITNFNQINPEPLNITHDNTKITIQANQAKFNLTDNTAHFLGNVIVTHNDNILHANKISFHKQLINNITRHTILSGTGDIYYSNNTINLTGKNIQTNLQTKNIDLYQGSIYFTKYKTYGIANHIKQRDNNRYTILQDANITTCPPNKTYWKITGSQILYDHQKDILNIWDAYFRIGNTPIVYIPYIQLSLEQKNNFGWYPPIPEYNENGIEIKLPYYFTINQYCHGNISTNFIPQKGIQLQNCIKYSKKSNTGLINFEILNSNQPYLWNWLLYYNLNNTFHKKWNISSHFIKTNNPNYLQNSALKQIHPTGNYYIKKTILSQYNDIKWNISLSYKEFYPLSDYIKNIYNTKPQLNFNFYTNKLKPISFHLFGQLTQFTNTNPNYPKTIRTHIEPSITTSSKIFNTHSNTEIKLKTTYYQQKNIDIYNTININNQLKHSTNRYIPQFKNCTKIILQKKNNILNKYKQTLEPKFQYLYVPYRNQKNIAIYDTTFFQTDYPDLFEDTPYSGLDRITPTNQLTSGLNSKIYNKKNTEVLNFSLSQIYFFTNINTTHYKKTHNHHNRTYNTIWATNQHWAIKKSLKINTGIQYDTKVKQFKSGNIIIEHKKYNNEILQINYRYLNSKYFEQIVPEPINPIHQKNITQIGIISNWPINSYWTIGGSQFYNIKNKHMINQTIGIQFHTCCWKISTGYERKINFQKTTTSLPIKYNNKLLFNLMLYQSNQNALLLQTQICDILNKSTLPYQTIL